MALSFGARAPIIEDPAVRAELRRQWGLLHSADLLVVDLRRSDLGYKVEIASSLDRHAFGDAETIAGALIAARKSLGYVESNGRLILLGTAPS